MEARTQYPKRSNFSIDQKPDGFRIVGGPNVPEVTVTRHSTHFAVDWTQESKAISTKHGFYCFRCLLDCSTEILRRDWNLPGAPFLQLPTLRVNETSRMIRERVHNEWRRLLCGADPIVLAVHRSIFAVTLKCPNLALKPELYKNKYVVSDILNYRAAAMATLIAGNLRPELGEFQIDAAIDLVNNWRNIFSLTNKTYSSLDKTLMNLPGGIPCDILYNLNKIFLRRPISNRLELILLCLYAQNIRRYVLQREETGAGESVEVYASPNENVFMFATSAQIKKAMALVTEHTRRNLSTRSLRDINFLVAVLLDFPDEHNGNIVGLTRKSIRWHREGQATARQRMLDRLGAATKTALPPIQWPERPEIKFLSTVDDIAEESKQMQHCVAAYAKNAVAGHCYLFHINRNDEQATVEVGRNSRVVQALGPKNRGNRAVEWGARLLDKWGDSFPEILPPSQVLPGNQ